MNAWLRTALCAAWAMAGVPALAQAPLPAPAPVAVPATLRACGDAAEFPPYIYYRREAGRKTLDAAGFDVDVLTKLLADAGRSASVVLLPWARCLALAERGQFDIVFDGVKSPSRERVFAFPRELYTLSSIFIYRKDRPKPPMARLDQIPALRICSQADYNYELLGIAPEMITTRARSIEDSAAMLKLDRCNVIIQNIEILRGHAALGGIDLLHHPDFATEVPGWVAPAVFYFMVPHVLPYRDALVELLDRGIARMRSRGELEVLLERQQHR